MYYIGPESLFDNIQVQVAFFVHMGSIPGIPTDWWGIGGYSDLQIQGHSTITSHQTCGSVQSGGFSESQEGRMLLCLRMPVSDRKTQLLVSRRKLLMP